MPIDVRPRGHLEGVGAVAQGLFTAPSSGPSALPKVEFLHGKPYVPDRREGRPTSMRTAAMPWSDDPHASDAVGKPRPLRVVRPCIDQRTFEAGYGPK